MAFSYLVGSIGLPKSMLSWNVPLGIQELFEIHRQLIHIHWPVKMHQMVTITLIFSSSKHIYCLFCNSYLLKFLASRRHRVRERISQLQLAHKLQFSIHIWFPHVFLWELDTGVLNPNWNCQIDLLNSSKFCDGVLMISQLKLPHLFVNSSIFCDGVLMISSFLSSSSRRKVFRWSKETLTWIKMERASGIILTGSPILLNVTRIVKMMLASSGALPKMARPEKITEQMMVVDIQYSRVP